MMQRLHCLVDGRVQGVGFRYFVIRQAEALGLTGWVANQIDGRVEVTAEGEYGQLQELLTKLNQGPGGAFVTDVSVEWQVASGEFDHFGLLNLL